MFIKEISRITQSHEYWDANNLTHGKLSIKSSNSNKSINMRLDLTLNENICKGINYSELHWALKRVFFECLKMFI